jgi:lipopolysaccharide/colanic/teichoic acid biosynthesis glycosyltransferase
MIDHGNFPNLLPPDGHSHGYFPMPIAPAPLRGGNDRRAARVHGLVRNAPRPRKHKPAQSTASRFHQNLAAGRPLVSPEGNLSWRYQTAKRLMDIFGALTLLVLLAPIMIVTFLVLLVTTRGKPLFRQVRLGWQGRPFTMYKFRTMVLDAEKRRAEVRNEASGPVFKNRRDPRITRIGRILRKTSIDETPQLFSVLAGHMSLVGPRPPLGSEVARYEPWQRRRLAVRPGLTCLWQISGRSEIGFEDWVRMDIWYLRNQSLRTDLELLIKTPWSVLTGRGAY